MPPWHDANLTCMPKVQLVVVNTLRLRQNCHNFPDDIFKCISLNKNVQILIKISISPEGPINNIPALGQMTRQQAIIWTDSGYIIDAYMRHLASITWPEITYTCPFIVQVVVWHLLCRLQMYIRASNSMQKSITTMLQFSYSEQSKAIPRLLMPWLFRSPTMRVLAMLHKWIFVFHAKGFQLPVSLWANNDRKCKFVILDMFKYIKQWLMFK